MTNRSLFVAGRKERRSFLKGALMGAGVLALGPRVSLAPRAAFGQSAPVDPRRFLFAYFEGGWDQLLALDPRDPATTNAREHAIDPGYGQFATGARGVQRAGGLSFGPAVPPEFIAKADRFSIVRGINMDTAAHEVGRRFFITGRLPQGLSAVGSSVAAEIAAELGDNSSIPYLAAAVEAYARGLPSFAQPLTVSSLTDLTVALTPFAQVPPHVLSAVEAFQDEGLSCTAKRLDAEGLATQVLESQKRARIYLEGELARIFDLQRTDPDMQALIQRYGLAGVGNPSDPRVLGFAAGQALKSGTSQVVSVRVALGLDTHSNWAQDQPGRLEQGFSVLASIIEDLEATPSPTNDGTSLMDHTTILAFSEFARTPLFNAIQGRDHFLGNSCLVAGPGLVRGRTIGASAEVGMMPVDVEPDTGRPRPDSTPEMRASGEVIPMGPAHVLAALLKSAGAPDGILREPPLGALLEG